MSKLVSVTTKVRFGKTDATYTAKFVRRCGRFLETIHATFDPGYGWQQWGASPTVLADNVPAVEAWVRSIVAEVV